MRWAIGVLDAGGNGGLDGKVIANLTLPQPAVDGPDGTNYQMFGKTQAI